MKRILNVIFMLILFYSAIAPQENDYWKNAPIEGSKIYSIGFTDQENGYAISANNEMFVTTDSGSNWKFINDKKVIDKSFTNNSLWVGRYLLFRAANYRWRIKLAALY